MKCPLCGFEFNQKNAELACKGCSFIKKCELIKCPNCNYETVLEPEWVKKFKKGRENKNDIDRQS